MEKVLLGAFYCLLLLSPAEAGSWICGSDFCTEGEEFCRPDKRTGEDTCHRCDNYKSLCFQDGHESNCTLWCTAELERSIRVEVKKELESKTCGEPPEVQHGKYNSTATSFKQGEQITITCKTGYKLMGKTKITCKTYGQWSEMPWCEAITCLVPDAPKHGYLVKPTYTTKDQKLVVHIGQPVQYACLHGYKLIGEGVITCNSDGQISRQPLICVAENSDAFKKATVVLAIAVGFLVILVIILGVLKWKATTGQQKSTCIDTTNSSTISTSKTSAEHGTLLNNMYYSSDSDNDSDKPESTPTEQMSETECDSIVIPIEQTQVKKSHYTKKSDNNNNNNNNNINNNIISKPGKVNMITSNDNVGGRNDISSSDDNHRCLLTNNNNNSDSNTTTPNNNNNNNVNHIHIDLHNHIHTITDNVPGGGDAYNAPRQDGNIVTASCIQEHGNGVQEEIDETETKRRYIPPRASAEGAEHSQTEENDEGEKAIGTSLNYELPSAERRSPLQLSRHNNPIQEQNVGREKITVGSREADRQDFRT